MERLSEARRRRLRDRKRAVYLAKAASTRSTATQTSISASLRDAVIAEMPPFVWLSDSLFKAHLSNKNVQVLSRGGEVVGQSLIDRVSVLRHDLRAIIFNHAANYSQKSDDNIDFFMSKFVDMCHICCPNTPIYYLYPHYFPYLTAMENTKIIQVADKIKKNKCIVCIPPVNLLCTRNVYIDNVHYRNKYSKIAVDTVVNYINNL